METRSKTPILKAKNLGPKSEEELNSIGINSLEKIRELGWEDVMEMWIMAYPERINLNAVIALIGAIEDCH